MVFLYHSLIVFIIFYNIVVSKCELSPFGYCIQQKPSPGIVNCVGRQALHSLAGLEENENITVVKGLSFLRNENQLSRSLPNFLDQDPMDFRGILENAGAVISQRTLQWDMSGLYPGLTMKIGPSHGTTGLLEFVMSPGSAENDRTYDEPPSTARILTKQFVVPFLLGLKFNLLTLLPLIIGGIILVLKKAALLGKLALFISTAFGIGNIFTLGSLGHHGIGGDDYGHGGGYGGHNQHHLYPGSGHIGGLGSFGGGHHGGYYKMYNPENDVNDKPTLPVNDNFYDYEKKVLMMRDRTSKLYERELNEEVPTDQNQNSKDRTENQPGYRAFAWKTVN